MSNWVYVVALVVGGLIPLFTLIHQAERAMSDRPMHGEVKFWCIVAAGSIAGLVLNYAVYVGRPLWWTSNYAMGAVNWAEVLFMLLIVSATVQRRRQRK